MLSTAEPIGTVDVKNRFEIASTSSKLAFIFVSLVKSEGIITNLKGVASVSEMNLITEG